MRLGRRAMLAGAAAWLAAPGLRLAWGASAAALDAILADSGLAALSGFALADLDGGAVIEGHRADAALPPASVAKLVTALYGLEALGPDYRFATRLLAAGPIEGGVLQGDLVLAGTGDPVLDTDRLAALAAALRTGGTTRVAGRFLVAAGALPAVDRIDAEQPEAAGYNAAVAGINLNFNRVYLEWGPGASGPELVFSAPGEDFDATVTGVAAELSAGGLATHRVEGGREVWTLPRPGLRGRGSVWLPVRAPGAYAGEVFATLAAGAGVTLPSPEVVPAASGAVLAVHESARLEALLRGMLRYSTNITAEAIGLRAAQAQGAAPDGLAASSAAMTGWARRRFGTGEAVFVNHSGLSDRSRISARDMLAVLRQGRALEGLMRERPILDAARQPVDIGGARVVAKTGTLNFTSGLAGYLLGRRRLAFAIFAADPALRAEVRPDQRDDPPGGAAWAARARAQEQALLRRWAALYA
jgi:D-alanyl-D-alanine carboxypeptidase/D-alanyl-D-alanine-endopeptidase (penicillin-binding protein 4)